MEDNDVRLRYFAETLYTRSVPAESWQLRAFAEKKGMGKSEATILKEAEEGTRVFKSRLLHRSALQGAALGAVIVPVSERLLGGERPWRELLSKSSKTAGIGVLVGGSLGWAVGEMKGNALDSAIKDRLQGFRDTTHQMELAWREALERRTAAEAAPEETGRGR